jgi:hypothetical protein
MVIPFWMVNGLDGSTGMPELVRQNERKIPSGYVKITMENNHRNSGFFPLKIVIFNSYGKLPEGIY